MCAPFLPYNTNAKVVNRTYCTVCGANVDA